MTKMVAGRGPRRTAALAVTAAVLALGPVGCGDDDDKAKTAAPSDSSSATSATSATSASPTTPTTPTTSASPSPTEPPTPPPTTAPSTSAPALTQTAPTTPKPPAPTTTPPKRTVLTVTASTAGGKLNLQRGGPAQEFTVTIRNGNTKEYALLQLAFQMESLLDGSLNGYVLEHYEGGTWRPAELRIAEDVYPYWLIKGGTPLAKDATRTERYRIKATTGANGIGSTPLEVYVVDTDASTESFEQMRPGHISIPHTTTRR